MAMLKRYLPILAVAVVLLAMSVGAIADTDESNPPGAGVEQVTEIEPAAREAMSVFERGRAAADALREDLATKMDAHADFGMNPALSRVSIGNATSSLYVIPARGHVCAALTVGEGANVTCPPTVDIAEGRAAPATVVVETGDIAIYGIVPDGVEAVSVQTGTTESTAVGTESNGYYTVVPAGTPLRTVSYTGPSGSVEFPIYDPTLVIEPEG
jgi:hypothetical protein